uniref:Uncharacterized protein n=1 Tax=Cucumis melo TaxID=3656 RepID=A0A9I9EF62_CUCME
MYSHAINQSSLRTILLRKTLEHRRSVRSGRNSREGERMKKKSKGSEAEILIIHSHKLLQL